MRLAEPDIGEAGRICVAAWRQLDAARPMTGLTIGMGGSALVTGMILPSEARSWCEWMGLEREATGIVMCVLRRLDVDRANKEATRINAIAKAASAR